MSFKDFPTELPFLTKALQNLLSEPFGPPPDMRSLGQKTYDTFKENSNDLDLIRKRFWRHVPYAIWLGENEGLTNSPLILKRYFEKELSNSLEDTRRPLKWGRPLVFIYVEKFMPDDQSFINLSKHADAFFKSPKIDNSSSIVGLVRSLDLFDYKNGPKNTAFSIVESRRTFKDWINIHELWPSFGTSPFAEAAFNEFLQSKDDLRRTNEYIDSLIEWSTNDQKTHRYPSSSIKIAEALLLPWADSGPNEVIKSKVMGYLLHHYKDPRIAKNLWHGVSKEALKVFISWINGRTLELFFRILQETADSIWQYRQRFWMAYFKAGHIDEAWVALGPDAAIALRKIDRSNELKYAKLFGSDSSQSILLLRIGQILFCEWSHNGRLRAQRVDSALAPAMYKSYYESDDLRFKSLDFNNELLQDPGLVHFSSQSGGWQDRARVFVQQQTGIRLSQAEVA